MASSRVLVPRSLVDPDPTANTTGLGFATMALGFNPTYRYIADRLDAGTVASWKPTVGSIPLDQKGSGTYPTAGVTSGRWGAQFTGNQGLGTLAAPTSGVMSGYLVSDWTTNPVSGTRTVLLFPTKALTSVNGAPRWTVASGEYVTGPAAITRPVVLAFTVDAAKQVCLYVDGKLASSGASTVAPPSEQYIYLGTDSSSTTSKFQGTHFELIVHDGTAHDAATVAQTSKDLAVWWGI